MLQSGLALAAAALKVNDTGRFNVSLPDHASPAFRATQSIELYNKEENLEYVVLPEYTGYSTIC
jgi:hypothetical protein